MEGTIDLNKPPKNSLSVEEKSLNYQEMLAPTPAFVVSQQ
jgi:hypothetical protein